MVVVAAYKMTLSAPLLPPQSPTPFALLSLTMDSTFDLQLTVAELENDDPRAYRRLISRGPLRIGWADGARGRRRKEMKIACEAAAFAVRYEMAKRRMAVNYVCIR